MARKSKKTPLVAPKTGLCICCGGPMVVNQALYLMAQGQGCLYGTCETGCTESEQGMAWDDYCDRYKLDRRTGKDLA